MGFLFDDGKAGGGVEKNAPKKWGPFFYLELLGRKFGLLFKSNIMYFLLSSPVIFAYHFFFFMVISSRFSSYEPMAVNQIATMLAVVIVVLWGSGPVSCGYTYILRNSAREEHAWLVSDFFRTSKENFKKSIVFVLVDFAVLMLGANAVNYYFTGAAENGMFLYVACVVAILMVIYTFMHFYMYEFAITFDYKLSTIYKNSFLMALANMPMNLFLTALVLVCSYFALGGLSRLGIIVVSLLLWISMMRFPIDFYTARTIKRKIIGDESERGSDE